MVKSLLEILTKKISQTFYKPIVAQLVTNVLGNKCFRREYFYNKHVEYFESVRG